MNDLRTSDFFSLDPMDTAFRNLLRPWRAELATQAPQIKLDVSEDDAQYMVKADIPGVRREDINVSVDGNQVTISAEVKKESEEKKGGRVLRSERQYGYATRMFSLDCEVDDAKADAKYENGVLNLKLPKKAAKTVKKLAID
jgi:HSP20 family protein